MSEPSPESLEFAKKQLGFIAEAERAARMIDAHVAERTAALRTVADAMAETLDDMINCGSLEPDHEKAVISVLAAYVAVTGHNADPCKTRVDESADAPDWF